MWFFFFPHFRAVVSNNTHPICSDVVGLLEISQGEGCIVSCVSTDINQPLCGIDGVFKYLVLCYMQFDASSS